MDIYGTLGPACADESILISMFHAGMTGIRLNLSHITLREAKPLLEVYFRAANEAGISAKLLIDMQGPELRVGKDGLPRKIFEGDKTNAIPFPSAVCDSAEIDDVLLLDDGKILAKVTEKTADTLTVVILRGGVLSPSKSVAIEGKTTAGPAVTEQDFANLCEANASGVTAVMQPFVRGKEDLIAVRDAMMRAGCPNLKLFAKIENLAGVKMLSELAPFCDEIVIARGDLGNAVPLWELPVIQNKIASECRAQEVPFMVVTQMLASMEHSPVPTRAEVNDIYHAVCDGASSVMVTGETAVGEYPVEVIQYLANTVSAALKSIK